MSANHHAWQLALREHAKTLTVCEALTDDEETPLQLGATTTQYTRNVGSWIADGFAVGMEVVASGFTNGQNNGNSKIIIAVSASHLTVTGGLKTEALATERTLEVGLPSRRAWENIDFTPVTGVPDVREQYIPGPSRVGTIGINADVDWTPMYALHVTVPAKTDVHASGRYADALLNHFAPRTTITASNGDVIRVRTEVGPFRSQSLNLEPGRSTTPVTFPLRVRTTNTL